jgi:hypothetical protein
MNQPTNLSLEQELNLTIFAKQVENLPIEQAKELLVELHRQIVIKDNLYRDLLKHYMGMESTVV